MFLDHVTIVAKGGNGGRGCVSFRREKYVPLGGPNGGDGGYGGNVILIADPNTDTLSDFATKKKFEAQKGRFGTGKNCNGRAGEDLYLHVPPGTTVIDSDTKEIIADLVEKDDQIVIAKGGRGGFGNAHFKTSTRRGPDFAELGEPGEERKIHLELKLVADVGIIGLPSAGKSTLISVISSAKPKIGAYAFTTLVPNLGVVKMYDREFIVCDVPGLIEGASEGKGLGDQFLRHIERCGILIHLLDVSRDSLVEDYTTIRKELEAYSPALAQKKELIVLNKIDIVNDDVRLWIDQLKKAKIKVHASISAVSKHGVDDLLKMLLPIVLEERKNKHMMAAEEQVDIPVLKPHLLSDKMGAFRIRKDGDTLIVEGKRLEQFTKMTDFTKNGAVQRFRDVIERVGLLRALKNSGATEDTDIYIGGTNIKGAISAKL